MGKLETLQRYFTERQRWRRRRLRTRILTDLDLEILYWMKATSRRRHAAPFSKLPRGRARRAARLFRVSEKLEFVNEGGQHGLDYQENR